MPALPEDYNYAGMNYDPASGGRVGPAASLNPGATAAEGARQSFLTPAEEGSLGAAIDAGLRGIMGAFGAKKGEAATADSKPAGGTGDLKEIEKLPPPPAAAPAAPAAPAPRARPAEAAIPDAAPPTPRARPDDMAVDDGAPDPARDFAQEEGAEDADKQAFFDLIDPEGRMPEDQKNIKWLANGYAYFIEQGREDLAQRAAGDILLNLRKQSAIYAARAVEALQNGDNAAAAKYMQEAYGFVPDGKEITLEVGPDGNGVYVQRDATGKVIAKGPFTPKDLLEQAIGVTNGDAFWSLLRTTAGEAGYGGGTGKTSVASGGPQDAELPPNTKRGTNRLTGEPEIQAIPETGEEALSRFSPEAQDYLVDPETTARVGSASRMTYRDRQEGENTARVLGPGMVSDAASEALAAAGQTPTGRVVDDGSVVGEQERSIGTDKIAAAQEVDAFRANAVKNGTIPERSAGEDLEYDVETGQFTNGAVNDMLDAELAKLQTRTNPDGEADPDTSQAVTLTPEQRDQFYEMFARVSRLDPRTPVLLVRPLLSAMFDPDSVVEITDGMFTVNGEILYLDGATALELGEMARQREATRQAQGATAATMQSIPAIPDERQGAVQDRRMDESAKAADEYMRIEDPNLSRNLPANPRQIERNPYDTQRGSGIPDGTPRAWGVERNSYSGGALEFDLGNGGATDDSNWVDPMQQNVPRERQSMTGRDSGTMAERSTPAPLQKAASIAERLRRRQSMTNRAAGIMAERGR